MVSVEIRMFYLLLDLSFPDLPTGQAGLIGESRVKNLRIGFPLKTCGNDEKATLDCEGF